LGLGLRTVAEPVGEAVRTKFLRCLVAIGIGLLGASCALPAGPQSIAVAGPKKLTLHYVAAAELDQSQVALFTPLTSDRAMVSKQHAADLAMHQFPVAGAQVRQEALARVFYFDGPRSGVLSWVVDVTPADGRIPIGTGGQGGPYPPDVKWLLVFVRADTGALLFAKAWAPPH
jgi:hypothetical protein